MFSLKVSNRRKYHPDCRPWRLQAYYQGALESSLCTSDSVLSACLPDDLSARYTHYAELPLWKREALKLPTGPTHTTKLGLALKDKGGFVFKASGGIEPVRPEPPTVGQQQGQATLSAPSQGLGAKGDASAADKPRMSSNGIQGSAMTGNTIPQGDSLQWLATDTPSSQGTGGSGQPPSAPQQPRPPATSLPSHSAREPLPILSHLGVNPVGVTPQGVGAPQYRSDPSPATQRLFQSGSLLGTAAAYAGSTSSSALSPYMSPLYSQPPYYMSPYHYPHNTGSLLPSYDHSSPYSLLHHHIQTQPLPRAPYLTGPYLPTQQNSPGPSGVPRSLTPSHLDSLRKSPKQEDRRGSPKDVKVHPMSVPPAHQHRAAHAPKPHHRDTSQDSKDPSLMAVLQNPLHHAHYEQSKPSPTQRAYEVDRPGGVSFVRPQAPPSKQPGLSDEPPVKRPRTVSGALREEGASSTLSRPPVDPSQPHYPPHFMKGSIIQLANGDLKRVEDLRTEDFVHSADISNDLKIDSSTVVRIDENIERGTALLGFSVGEHRVQVTVEATLEHPFFVFGQGWSSCSPERTLQRYDLSCHRLIVGDVCISLTHKDVSSAAQTAKGPSSSSSSSSHDRPSGGASDFSAARLLSSTPRSRDASDYPRDLSLHGSRATTTSRPIVQRRWSAPDQISPPNSTVPLGLPSTTSRSTIATSPSRGHSPISVGRETVVTSSSGPTSPGGQRSDL